MLFLDKIWLIPLLPAAGASIMFFFGRRLSKSAVNAVCVGSVVLAFVLAIGAVLQLSGWAHSNPDKLGYEKVLYTWLGSDTGHLTFTTHNGTQAEFKADAGFYLDPLSSIWLLFVTGVYLLIGFYFHRKSASDAANKAFIVNRIGDAGFILGAFTLAWYLGSFRFIDINAAARSGHFTIGDPILTAAALLLFVGATGKSAQIPLYVWLPDAMEGPTPVSALIHAATMVTAGVYMVVRSNAIFVLAPTAMKTVAIIGALTAIFAASIGLVQNDIKRVLAYSTVSQLGYM